MTFCSRSSFYKRVFTKAIFLLALIDSRVCAYGCINMPNPPLNGKLYEPQGFLLARLTCPTTTDIPLNVRNGGLLMCKPRERLYDFEHIPKYDCLPKKSPKSILMRFQLFYLGKICGYDKTINLKVQAMQMDIEQYLDTHEVKGNWNSPVIRCAKDMDDVNAAYSFRYDITMTLILDKYNPKKGYVYYVNLLHDTTAQTESNWTLPGYIRLSDSHIQALAFCENNPNSVGTDLEKDKAISCRGCPRDYAINTNGECEICSHGKYTLGAFSNSCVLCPPKTDWPEGEALYERYCLRMQADYGNY